MAVLSYEASKENIYLADSEGFPWVKVLSSWLTGSKSLADVLKWQDTFVSVDLCNTQIKGCPSPAPSNALGTTQGSQGGFKLKVKMGDEYGRRTGKWGADGVREQMVCLSPSLSFWWRPLGIGEAFKHSFRGQRQISELCSSPPSGRRQRLACSWQVCACMCKL